MMQAEWVRFTPFLQMSYKETISDVFLLFFFLSFLSSQSAVRDTCEVREVREGERLRGWQGAVMCDVWMTDVHLESRSGVYMLQRPAQPGAHTLRATVCQVTWCVCLCVCVATLKLWLHAWRYKKAYIVLSLLHTSMCLCAGAMLQQLSAPQSLSRGPEAKFSAHVQRSLIFSLFLSRLHSIAVVPLPLKPSFKKNTCNS